MKGWIVLIIVLIIVGIGYYAYSKSNGFSGILGSVTSSFSPSIEQIEANVSNYVGRQVTLSGELNEPIWSVFNYTLNDYQGYTIGLQQKVSGQTLFDGANYSVTGTIGVYTLCSCPDGDYYNGEEVLISSTPAIINSNNRNTTCASQYINQTTFTYQYHYFSCPLSQSAYMNATKFVRT